MVPLFITRFIVCNASSSASPVIHPAKKGELSRRLTFLHIIQNHRLCVAFYFMSFSPTQFTLFNLWTAMVRHLYDLETKSHMSGAASRCMFTCRGLHSCRRRHKSHYFVACLSSIFFLMPHLCQHQSLSPPLSWCPSPVSDGLPPLAITPIQCQAALLDQTANFLMPRTYSGSKMLIPQSRLTMLPPPLPSQLLPMPPPPSTPFLVGQPPLLKAQLLVDLDMRHDLPTGSPTLITLKDLLWLQDTSARPLTV